MPIVTSRPGAARPAVPDVLLEHLEELAFLWIQRRGLLFSDDVPLRRMPAHDERIEAHQDGLRIGGAASVEVAAPLLEDGNPWLAAAALWTWLSIGEPQAAAAFARLDGMPPELDRAWREALRWTGPAVGERLFASGSVRRLPARALALAIEPLASQGRLEPAIADHAARSEDARVRAALARVLAWPGTGTIAGAHLPGLTMDADPEVRRRARWSEGLRDAAAAVSRLRRAKAEQVDAHGCRMLGLLGEREDAATLARLAEDDRLRPAALLALGDLGTRDAVETLLRVCAVPDEAVQAEAIAGLERALGPLAPGEGEEPPPSPVEAARQRWMQVTERIGESRACRGLAMPWAGEAADEPAWWTWRRAIVSPSRSTRRWAAEVPNGFWLGTGTLVSEPGS